MRRYLDKRWRCASVHAILRHNRQYPCSPVLTPMPQLPKSFIRWQGVTITQMGFVMNLVLTLSVGSLGFGLSLVKDQVIAGWWGRCLPSGCLCLLLSIALGIWGAVNRLVDFRITTRIARVRQKMESRGRSQTPLSRARKKSARLGKRTWSLLCWQLSTFFIGILLISASFLFGYPEKNQPRLLLVRHSPTAPLR